LETSHEEQRGESIPRLLVVKDFLPKEVAHGLLTYLESLDESEWILSTSEHDAKMHDYKNGSGTTEHSFSACNGIILNSSKCAEVHSETDTPSSAMDKFLCILSASIHTAKLKLGNRTDDETLFTFQCGRYSAGHFIDPHDDSATEEIDGVIYERDLAIVLHLSRDWHLEYGGLFADMEYIPPHILVPQYNSLVLFKVPRLHQVTPIEKTARGQKRYSIFGWALKKQKTCPNSSNGSGSSISVKYNQKKTGKKRKRGDKAKN
jgi:Rps23 Pro-64 3,4-dihydroxylase Tpa1-like proline 4-hydroxylase